MITYVVTSFLDELEGNELESAKCIEFRLDAYKELTVRASLKSKPVSFFEKLKKQRASFLEKKSSLCFIFTLRRHNQGGLYQGNDEEYLSFIHSMIALDPDYIDLDISTPNSMISLVKKNTSSKIICSYHDFEKTPKIFPKPFNGADHFKLAFFANTTCDALRMLNYSKGRSSFTGICMGEKGQITRITAPIFSDGFQFIPLKRQTPNDQKHPGNTSKNGSIDDESDDEINATMDSLIDDHTDAAMSVVSNDITNSITESTKDAKAPGQLSYEELEEIYYYSSINKETKIYALIGSPVYQSRSHLTHNRVFRALGENALYLKLQVEANELEEFFEEVKTLPFMGFSVTVPLKEKVQSYIYQSEEKAVKIGAVNTLKKYEKSFLGYNTDADGALDAIEEMFDSEFLKNNKTSELKEENIREGLSSVSGKKIVVLGAGGSARAIVYEAKRRGAIVSVFNRTESKAKLLAGEFQCRVGLFEDYDILINTTPCGMKKAEIPVDASYIKKGKVIMDIILSPLITPLLKASKAKNALIIPGSKMWKNQALYQFEIWLSRPIAYEISQLLDFE